MPPGWLVIGVSLASAFAFAVSSSLKHVSAGQGPDAQDLGARSLVGFVRATLAHPLWLGGIGADVVGPQFAGVRTAPGCARGGTAVADQRFAVRSGGGADHAPAAALLKAITTIALRGPIPLFTSWQLYTVVVLGAAGLLLNQVLGFSR